MMGSILFKTFISDNYINYINVHKSQDILCLACFAYSMGFFYGGGVGGGCFNKPNVMYIYYSIKNLKGSGERVSPKQWYYILWAMNVHAGKNLLKIEEKRREQKFCNLRVDSVSKRNFIFSFTDFKMKILGRRRVKKEKKIYEPIFIQYFYLIF